MSIYSHFNPFEALSTDDDYNVTPEDDSQIAINSRTMSPNQGIAEDARSSASQSPTSETNNGNGLTSSAKRNKKRRKKAKLEKAALASASSSSSLSSSAGDGASNTKIFSCYSKALCIDRNWLSKMVFRPFMVGLASGLILFLVSHRKILYRSLWKVK